MIRTLILAACLLVTTAASAEPTDSTGTPDPTTPADPAAATNPDARTPAAIGPQAPQQDAPPSLTEPCASCSELDDKDPMTGLEISLGTTLGGVVLAGLGAAQSHDSGGGQALGMIGSLVAVVGPTLGHAYAGDIWNGGLGMRLVGTGAAVAGIVIMFDACPLFDPCTGQQKSTSDLGQVIALGGVFLYLGGAVYEIASVPAAVREHNRRRHGEGPSAAVTVAPIRSQNTTSPGLALVGRF